MQQDVLSPDRRLSRAEIESTFGLSRRFLEVSAVRGGGPPMVKIGRSVRYRAGDVRTWIEAGRVDSTSQGVGK
jgi:predicted DNA-binding transcriptional regulator AlpA